MTRIGVTETYDPAHCINDWYPRYEEFDLVVFITKSLSSLIDILTKDEHWSWKNKPSIIHVTCTGWGGTFMEPGAPSPRETLEAVNKLVALGFPAHRIVLRVDPVIPGKDGFKRAIDVLEMFYLGSDINRVRLSVLDMYPHTRKRLEEAGCTEILGEYGPDSFTAGRKWFDMLNELVSLPDFSAFTFEACCESKLVGCKQRPCISELDFKLNDLVCDVPQGKQRSGCMCLIKKQLIPGGMTRGRCPNICKYCYLK